MELETRSLLTIQLGFVLTSEVELEKVGEVRRMVSDQKLEIKPLIT